jgi:hypothetical protein
VAVVDTSAAGNARRGHARVVPKYPQTTTRAYGFVHRHSMLTPGSPGWSIGLCARVFYARKDRSQGCTCLNGSRAVPPRLRDVVQACEGLGALHGDRENVLPVTFLLSGNLVVKVVSSVT